MKTTSEIIADYAKAKTQKMARMDEIKRAAAARGETFDEAESEEYGTLVKDVKAINAHIDLLKLEESEQGAAAKPVTPGAVTDIKSGAEARAGSGIEVKGVNLAKGTAFTRYAIALALGKGNINQSMEIAKKWDDTPEVESVLKQAFTIGNTNDEKLWLKAAVAPGTSTDSTWAGPLAAYNNMASEFAELLRPLTIIGRIQGFRRVPFNVNVPRQTGGSSAAWVGEAKPASVSKLAFDQVSLGIAKLAGIVVFTEELLRTSNPVIEELVRNDLAATIVQTMDNDFLDPAKALVANVSPASLTNGVTPTIASGTDADAVRADAKAVMAIFLAANLSLAGAVWAMSETTALALSLMVTALGTREFPDINGVTGGTFFGLPVILSQNVKANPGSGSPITGNGDRIHLVKASEVLLADEGQVLLDASSQASLQMDGAPDSPPTSTTTFVSLWQEGLVGIRALRFINWAKRRAGAAQYIDRVKYGS